MFSEEKISELASSIVNSTSDNLKMSGLIRSLASEAAMMEDKETWSDAERAVIQRSLDFAIFHGGFAYQSIDVQSLSKYLTKYFVENR